MNRPDIKIYRLLRPVSWLYGLGVNFRNRLFNSGVLKQKKFDIPIICVGNITVGGTGKTPHTEYLIRLLLPQYKVAVLSRGYGRKSNDFRIVEVDSKAQDVGDEPLQIKQKYPDTLVVVDKNRTNAIEKMLSFEEKERPDVILLDDGFQHRYVQPSLSIALINSHRPVFEDELLPAGLLREPISGLKRADIVLITKCKNDITPSERNFYEKGLKLHHNLLFFTSFDYGTIQPVFPDLQNEPLEINDLQNKHILLVAGIASPQPLVEKLKQKTNNLRTQFFPDHHFFNKKDIESIQQQINTIADNNKIILTTEKDTVRFRTLPFLNEDVKKRLYFIPIEVKFVDEEEKNLFHKTILEQFNA